MIRTLRSSFLPLGLLLPLLGAAQPTTVIVLEDSITRAIDAQVWRPFVKAFDTRNAEAFIALHAGPVIRWPLGWGLPQTADSIAAQARRNWGASPTPDEIRRIEFYFTHRSRTATFAYDLGYYRVVVAMANGVGREHYGHFTTILGKEDGLWKIFLDADNAEGVGMDDLAKGVLLKKE